MTFVLVCLAIAEKPRELGAIVLYIIGGVPVYFFCIKWQRPAKLFGYLGKFLGLKNVTGKNIRKLKQRFSIFQCLCARVYGFTDNIS